MHTWKYDVTSAQNQGHPYGAMEAMVGSGELRKWCRRLGQTFMKSWKWQSAWNRSLLSR